MDQLHNFNQYGGMAFGVKVFIFIMVIAVIGVGIGLAVYYGYYKPKQDAAAAAATTPPATTPPTTPTTLKDCPTLNSHFTATMTSTPTASATWSDDNRNTAIWIINNQYPTLTVPYLQGLSNAVLQLILQQYCGPVATPTADCKALNSNYNPATKTNDPTTWSDTPDRNTVIWLIANRNPAIASTLQGMNNATLQKLLNVYCM